jgi:hypothetical protein
MHPRPYSMRAARVNKGRNQHNRAAACSNGLTQGLPTPSLREAGLGAEGQHALGARSIRIRASTSISISSAEKERMGQSGLGYLHIVISHRRSGWTRWLMKVQRMSAPNSPSWSKHFRMSSTGHSLWMSFLATPYPHLLGAAGCLPITTGSGASMSFFKKDHCLHRLAGGLGTVSWKYRSTSPPVQT